MRLLFEMDKKDHERCTHSFVRNSARTIVVRSVKDSPYNSTMFEREVRVLELLIKEGIAG